ncbi:hypothetical protein FM106_12275 [Brachybacterium faecium]|nr:hypothetical protein FM106_12275 [Brachybacterium faecium]
MSGGEVPPASHEEARGGRAASLLTPYRSRTTMLGTRRGHP